MERGCITLIGMPSSGKSTIGVVLAKMAGMRFLDGDLLIQEKTGKRLMDLIAEYGDDGFREIEDRICAGIEAENTVIAPGGSVVYGENAMKHLKSLGPVVYLKLSYPAVRRRVGNLLNRGVTMKKGQTFRQLYDERCILYGKYADIVIDETGLSIRQTAEEILSAVGRGDLV